MSSKHIKSEPVDTSASTGSSSNRNTSFDALLSTTESLLNLENSTAGDLAATSSSATVTMATASAAAAIKNQHFGKSNVSGEDIENFFSALTKLGSDVIQMATLGSGGPVESKPVALDTTTTTTLKAEPGFNVKKRAGDKKSNKSSSKRAKPTDDRASRTGESPKKARRRSSSSSLVSTASSSLSSSAASASSSSSSKRDAASASSDESDLDDSSDDEAGGRDNYETDSYDRTKHHDDDDDDSSDSSSSTDDSGDESDESAARKKGGHKKDESVKRSKKPGGGGGKSVSGQQKSVKSSKKPSNSGAKQLAAGVKSVSKRGVDDDRKQKRRYTMVNRRPGGQGTGTESTTKSRTSDQANKKPPVVTQCLGPGCVNAVAVAALGDSSKYCSDQCGLALARERLLAFLEPHLAEYQKLPCYSDIHNQTQLAKINTEIQSLRQKLVELEARHVDLDKLLEKAKSAKIDPNVEVSLFYHPLPSNHRHP